MSWSMEKTEEILIISKSQIWLQLRSIETKKGALEIKNCSFSMAFLIKQIRGFYDEMVRNYDEKSNILSISEVKIKFLRKQRPLWKKSYEPYLQKILRSIIYHGTTFHV